MVLIRILTWVSVGLGLLLTGGVREASAQGANVCDRTLQVNNAIVAASGAATCVQVTPLHLRDITTLDLSDQGITSLLAGDFNGLVRLDSLDLSGNALASLPSGVFDEFYLLKTLRLDGNLLQTLPEGIFDELFLLEELTLHENRITSLPDGLFEELSRFDGMQADGSQPDNSGAYPRIQRYLDRHEVSSPEEFIAALPTPYLQRFVLMYRSESPAAPHVSEDYPRVISFGGDGAMTFAWTTDPSAPAPFRQSVEFLRQNDTDWTAGVIDFSGARPQIIAPASCKSCHGLFNKPMWGMWGQWSGSEHVSHPRSEEDIRSADAAMGRVMASSDPLTEPLDFSTSSFETSFRAQRFFWRGPPPSTAVAEEAGAVWAWRHAEVLYRILRGRYPDFRSFSDEVVCAAHDDLAAFAVALNQFSQPEQNLFASDADPRFPDQPGYVISPAPDLLTYTYYYHTGGSVADSIVFLLIADVLRDEPIVRRLYRSVSNSDAVVPHVTDPQKSAMLYYGPGSATAEDELIQKLRLHFGQGTAASLDAREAQSGRHYLGGVLSASFRDGLATVMRPRMCSALTGSVPGGLRASPARDDVELSWEAPQYDPDGLTGYRILRSADGNDAEVFVADTGSTGTTWTDEDPALGEYVYTVQALYDGYYASRESEEARATVGDTAGTAAPSVEEPRTHTVLEGETAVITLAATDEDTSASALTWSIREGADSGAFAITTDGALSFLAAKDFESPDDVGGDGTYALTVQVSDGKQSGTADLSVTLANRNEAPTANAGADQDGIEGGATVSLSGTGTDPDADDTLSYGWTQTAGTTVTLSAADTAATSFTAPSNLPADETPRFTLRVTDAGGLYAEDEVAVTISAPVAPLTTRFEGIPDMHNGQSPFTFELHFSEEIAISYKTLRDRAFAVTGGTVTGTKRMVPPSNLGWRITVEPTSDADVVLSLAANRSCETAGAICTASGKPLSNGLAATIPIEPDLPVVSIAAVASPVSEGQRAAFRVSLAEPATKTLIVRIRVTATIPYGGSTVLQFNAGESSAVGYTELDDDTIVRDDVTLTWALAEGDGYQVSAEAASAQVVLKENDVPDFALSLDPAEVAEGEFATAQIEITNGVTFATGRLIALVVTGGTATEARDFTVSPKWLFLRPGTGSLTARVAAQVDGEEEDEETVEIAATHDGKTIGTGTLTITGVDGVPLTARVEGLPERHDGSAAFTFQLQFSEEIDVSYVTLRDVSFDVTRGSVIEARRLARPSNRDWEITVSPDSNANVVLVLAADRACDTADAICTAGGERLSNRLEITIRGPG